MTMTGANFNCSSFNLKDLARNSAGSRPMDAEPNQHRCVIILA